MNTGCETDAFPRLDTLSFAMPRHDARSRTPGVTCTRNNACNPFSWHSACTTWCILAGQRDGLSRCEQGESSMAQHTHANGNNAIYQPDDAMALLTADHRQVRALFQQYADTPDPYLKQIIAEHVFAEQADEEGKRLVREARQDHQ